MRSPSDVKESPETKKKGADLWPLSAAAATEDSISMQLLMQAGSGLGLLPLLPTAR